MIMKLPDPQTIGSVNLVAAQDEFWQEVRSFLPPERCQLADEFRAALRDRLRTADLSEQGDILYHRSPRDVARAIENFASRSESASTELLADKLRPGEALAEALARDLCGASDPLERWGA
jgi:hypothetical protein